MTTERQQVEKLAGEVFHKEGLRWTIASVTENRAAHAWDIEVQTPEGRELILSIPDGSPKELKHSLREQTEEEMDRLHIR
jgi:hypothetical protein